jgi:hypothetical protein
MNELKRPLSTGTLRAQIDVFDKRIAEDGAVRALALFQSRLTRTGVIPGCLLAGPDQAI